jgi:hypothetical protein
VTDLDIAALRRTAEAATTGKWKIESNEYHFRLQASDGTVIQVNRGHGCPPPEADADFIATFDPSTVVALLDALAAQQKVVEAARWVAETWAAYADLTGAHAVAITRLDLEIAHLDALEAKEAGT